MPVSPDSSCGFSVEMIATDDSFQDTYSDPSKDKPYGFNCREVKVSCRVGGCPIPRLPETLSLRGSYNSREKSYLQSTIESIFKDPQKPEWQFKTSRCRVIQRLLQAEPGKKLTTP